MLTSPEEGVLGNSPDAQTESASARAQKRVGFFDLAREIRDDIYYAALVEDDAIDPVVTFPPCHPPKAPTLNFPAILLLNKRAHQEATETLYSKNQFEFELGEHLHEFLETIGPWNAKLLRSICIPFPEIWVSKNAVLLDEDSEGAQILRQAQAQCPGITSLAVSAHSTQERECQLGPSNDDEIKQAFNLIDAHFKSLRMLRVVCVSCYDTPESYPVRKQMSLYGWEIVTVPDEYWDPDDDFDYVDALEARGRPYEYDFE